MPPQPPQVLAGLGADLSGPGAVMRREGWTVTADPTMVCTRPAPRAITACGAALL
jgi:hypothetical protein